jgi:thioredoxin reductase (NADPH)
VAEYDTVVIGGGLAGSTAALFSARLGHSTLLLNSGLPGGQLLNVAKIEDFPGFASGVEGFELCPAVQEQALEAGATFQMAEAHRLEPGEGEWTVISSSGEVTARSVVVATGGSPRSLGVPGEAEFTGMGISHCASCDGPLYRGQVVGVVGGGDSALQEALELTAHVERVVILHRGSKLSGQASYQRRVLESPQIELRFGTQVREVLGEGKLKAVRVEDGSGISEVELGGLFVYIGNEPNSSLVGDLVALDHHGRIPTDLWMRTELPGLLAAGEARSESAAQAVTVAGDGATAAIAAHRYLTTGAWHPVSDAVRI